MAARRDIIKEGERPNSVHLILSGFACRYKITAGGTRQIVALLLPGDFCDLHVAILGEMDHSIGTLSNCSAVANSVNRFRQSCLAAPRVGGAAVDVGPDLLGVGARAVVLARSAQFPSLGISNSPRTFGSRYQQKHQQSGPLQWAFACIFNASRQLSREIRNRTSSLSYCYYCDLFRGAPGRNRTSTPCGTRF